MQVYVYGYHYIQPSAYNTKNIAKYMEKLLHLYLLHVGEHTVGLVNKIAKLALYIQKSKVIIKGKT